MRKTSTFALVSILPSWHSWTDGVWIVYIKSNYIFIRQLLLKGYLVYTVCCKWISNAHGCLYKMHFSLLVQLARDLQKDFYQHFQKFFELLVRLLNSHSQDTELLEQIFSALSFIFKFLWRYLLQDIAVVYEYAYRLFTYKY